MTARALQQRGRAIIWRAAICAAIVFIGDYLLRRFFGSGGFFGVVIAGIVFISFAGFIGGIWSWFGFNHMRHILKGNPWVEWYARSGPICVGGHEVKRVVVLAHPDWPTEEVRTLHPKKLARSLTGTKPETIWAAGDPQKTMTVSPVGGAMPLHALRPTSKWLRLRWKHRLETGD